MRSWALALCSLSGPYFVDIVLSALVALAITITLTLSSGQLQRVFTVAFKQPLEETRKLKFNMSMTFICD